MSARRHGARAPGPAGHAPGGAERGVAVGFLAIAPLLVAYECARTSDGVRNTAERLLALPLARAGIDTPAVRVALLALLFAVATRQIYRRDFALLPRVWRIGFEGLAWGALLGPLLLFALRVAGLEAPAPELAAAADHRAAGAAGVRDAALLCGGAAYEEIAFRIGVQSLAYLWLASLGRLCALQARATTAVAEVGSVLAAAAVFAAAHLDRFASLAGARGEPFEPRVFTWRVAAGILLSVLFRWRGVGVAAWAHAGFDLALLVGAGPHVFL